MPKKELVLLAMEESPTLSLLERALHASGYDVLGVQDSGSLDKALSSSLGSALDRSPTEQCGGRQFQ